MEALITVPLEQALNGVPGLDVMRSKSVPQLSSIVLIFEPGTDLLGARQLVQSGWQRSAPVLPDSGQRRPSCLQPLSATSRVMKIGLSSDDMSLIDLSMIAYWKIRARLLQVPGVANVAIWGERKEQLHIQVDPERLLEHDVTLNEVMEATGTPSTRGFSGTRTGR